MRALAALCASTVVLAGLCASAVVCGWVVCERGCCVKNGILCERGRVGLGLYGHWDRASGVVCGTGVVSCMGNMRTVD